ncbi:Scd6-like Sm domain-containing protein [Xylariales sp. AK1849]|nr:Scd6-like Sm domain-containing protein [Xylariales sp. AK1849]
MSEFLGSRISLISKSDIRYSGVLAEINSEESTVSLENVRSFGTEGRRGNPEEELLPSDQVYEYIVFRGSDVKDLRIDEAPAAKENKPPAVPDDPAIVGARARPAGPSAAAPGPGPGPGPGLNNPQAGFNNQPPPPFQQHNFYPPGPGGPWGGRGGPGPDPRFGGMPYPPPPGWFPPGQGFPPGPPGPPGPFNQFGYPPGPGPHGHPNAPGQGMRGTPQQDNNPTPIGAGVSSGPDQSLSAGTPTHAELSAEPKSLGQPPKQPINAPAPTPPVESKPSAEEVKATAQSLTASGPARAVQQQSKNIPTGPKNNRVTPAVPFPTAILSKSGPSSQPAPQVNAAAVSVKPAVSANTSVTAAAIRDATQQAKDAVAVAMAKLNATNAGGPVQATNGTGNAMDNLTNKVNEMRVNATRVGPNNRGRGRGNRSGGPSKIDVPDADFDFGASNAKFNKEDLVKEAIAGSPLGEVPAGATPEVQEPAADAVAPAEAYNKTRSFFDNISSESKDRAESTQKPGGREWRGEEQRKNMETFGQGSVDGGYRGYRGRGRGRGRGGSRGRGYGSRSRGGDQGVV